MEGGSKRGYAVLETGLRKKFWWGCGKVILVYVCGGEVISNNLNEMCNE
jgi:hypothetical protein